MLPELVKDAIFSREEPASVYIGSTDAWGIPVEHVDGAKEGFGLQGKIFVNDSTFEATSGVAIGEQQSGIDQSWAFRDLRASADSDAIVVVIGMQDSDTCVDKFSTFGLVIVVGEPGQATAESQTLVIIDTFFDSFADRIEEDPGGPSKFFIFGGVVKSGTDFAISGEDILRRDGAFEEDVVGVVGDLFQTEGDEEISDSKATEIGNIFHGQVCVFDLGGDIGIRWVITEGFWFESHLQSEVEDIVSGPIRDESKASEVEIIVRIGD